MPRTAATATVKKTAPVRRPASAIKTDTAPKKRAVRVKKDIVDGVVNINAYIPDPSVAKKYVGRKINGVWDVHLFENAIANKRNVLLMGDTGSGKTMSGEAFAALKQMYYYRVPCDVSIDPSALFGKMHATDVPGKFEWQDGPVTQVVRNGGVLNISEINMMSPKIGASLYPLLDGMRYIPLLAHKGEIVRAHDNLLILADMNPGYRGTMDPNAAFKNRYPFKVMWGYDDGVEAKLIHFPSLRDFAKKVREMVGVEIMTPVSTNMLMEFESFSLDPVLGLEFAKYNFINAFDESERGAIENILNLTMPLLQQEVAVALGAADEDDEDGTFTEYEFSTGGF